MYCTARRRSEPHSAKRPLWLAASPESAVAPDQRAAIITLVAVEDRQIGLHEEAERIAPSCKTLLSPILASDRVIHFALSNLKSHLRLGTRLILPEGGDVRALLICLLPEFIQGKWDGCATECSRHIDSRCCSGSSNDKLKMHARRFEPEFRLSNGVFILELGQLNARELDPSHISGPQPVFIDLNQIRKRSGILARQREARLCQKGFYKCILHLQNQAAQRVKKLQFCNCTCLLRNRNPVLPAFSFSRTRNLHGYCTPAVRLGSLY